MISLFSKSDALPNPIQARRSQN